MYCSICEIEVGDDIDYRNINGRIVCDSCFEENYHYCSRCDAIIHSDVTYWDDYGDPLCEDCREEEEKSYDEECPDNPDVSLDEIKSVVELANQWLNDDSPKRYNISIRSGDFHLTELRIKVGLIVNPVYVFGLYDRTDYQISASQNLINQVKDFIEENKLGWTIHEGIGTNRIGLAYSIRANEFDQVLSLIKQITENKLCAV